ncbi:MAG: hypothetical protein MUF14_07590 [Hyphomonadaceae bacterium]|jgi:hypothetical protein|nr:hypothetical protein [Hyphomonadaceae bacterium]
MTAGTTKRSFLSAILGSATLGGSAAVLTGCVTVATGYETGLNDSDPTDAAGYGRGGGGHRIAIRPMLPAPGAEPVSATAIRPMKKGSAGAQARAIKIPPTPKAKDDQAR